MIVAPSERPSLTPSSGLWKGEERQGGWHRSTRNLPTRLLTSHSHSDKGGSRSYFWLGSFSYSMTFIILAAIYHCSFNWRNALIWVDSASTNPLKPPIVRALNIDNLLAKTTYFVHSTTAKGKRKAHALFLNSYCRPAETIYWYPS